MSKVLAFLDLKKSFRELRKLEKVKEVEKMSRISIERIMKDIFWVKSISGTEWRGGFSINF